MKNEFEKSELLHIFQIRITLANIDRQKTEKIVCATKKKKESGGCFQQTYQ